MKKVALLLATLMVISLLPMATFAADVTSADGLTITAIDNGVSTNVTAPLTDTITYSLGVGMLMYHQDGNYLYSGAKAASYVHKFTKDATDKILEFNWNGGKAIRRVDLWISQYLPASQYEIQIKDGDNWVKHAEGAFLGNGQETRQCDYHALLFDPIPADSTALRVVLKGVKADKDLYIGEARISDNNDYNLIAYGMNADDFEAGRMNGYNKSSSYTNGSKYYSGVVATNAYFSGITNPSYHLNNESMCRNFAVIWPCALNSAAKQYLIPNENGSLYYAVNFSGRYPNRHAVKVNRVKVNMNAGSAEGFDVYVDAGSGMDNLKSSGTASTGYLDANVSDWTKVASYEGQVKGADWAVLDIPNSVSNGQWMVVFKNPSEDAQVANIEMYQMAEDELNLGGEDDEEIELPDEYILAIDNGQKTIVTEKLSDGITLNWIQLTYRHKTVGSYWYYDAVNTPYAQVFADDTNNKTLEFKWEEGKAIRRLDLWMACNNPFTTYEIQISDGEGGWTKHAEGTMTTTGDTRQYNYYPLLFNPIPADSTALRLVMKNVTKQIYISEARISESNEYNLIAYGGNTALLETDDFTSYGEKNGESDSYCADHYFSGNLATHALFSGFVSNNDKGSGYSLNKASMVREFGMLWPAHLNLGNTKGYLSAKTNAAGNPECYYAVDFSGRFAGAYPIKVNRIKVNMNAGSAKGFTVYSGNGTAFNGLMSESGYPDVNTSAWTKVATYEGRISGADYKELDIPAASAAGCWLVVFNEPSADIQVANIQMHQAAESELATGTTLTGEVAPGETVTLKGSYTADKNVTVMFGLYEGNKLVGIANGGSFTLNGKGQYVATYTIPEEGVAAEGLTVKAFLWNNLDDLQPLQAPITLS